MTNETPESIAQNCVEKWKTLEEECLPLNSVAGCGVPRSQSINELVKIIAEAIRKERDTIRCACSSCSSHDELQQTIHKESVK